MATMPETYHVDVSKALHEPREPWFYRQCSWCKPPGSGVDTCEQGGRCTSCGGTGLADQEKWPRDLCVSDNDGIVHLSVLVERESVHSIDAHGPIVATLKRTPCLVLLCEMVDAIDAATEIGGHVVPARRWRISEEAPGVPSCVRCAST